MSDASTPSSSNLDTGSTVYTAQHDPETDGKLSTTVLMALDSVPDIDIEDSEFVVFDYIDLDALDSLFDVAETNQTGEVRFTIDNYDVSVMAAGEVIITERNTADTRHAE